MLPISSSFSFVHSLTPEFFWSISSFSSLTISRFLLLLVCPPFHHLQLLSNLPQYSWLYLLSDHLNSFLAINLPGNSPLLNVPFSCFCLATSFISRWYSFSNSLIASFVFFKFSLSQTSFGYISTNSLTILIVLTATESPWKDLSIDTSHVLKRSVLAEILGRSTGNHHGTIY